MNKFVSYCFFVSCALIPAQQLFALPSDNSTPCFAGTLLAEYGTNTPPGTLAIQPYIFFTRQLGIYDANSSLIKDRNDHLGHILLAFETGITKKIDVSLYLNAAYTSAGGEKSFDYGDTVLLFGFQIAQDKKNTWIPDIRIMIGESFPTGKFDRLGTKTKGMNSTGTGAYETIFIFIIRKIYYNLPKHPYNWNLNLYYISSSKVDIEGVSIYGGDFDTLGRVEPGDLFIANWAFEYKFDKHWGAGIDLHYQHANITPFHPKIGNVTPAGLPSSENFSLLPQVEYCFNENLSVNAGWWFSVWGRNSLAFQSLGITLFYQF